MVSSSQEIVEGKDEGVLDVTWVFKCAVVVGLASVIEKVGLVDGDCVVGGKC